MELKKLRDDLARGEFKAAYLLFGEERFLVGRCAAAVESAAKGPPVCKDVFDGAVPVQDIMIAAETLPFLAEKRLVYVRDSKLFSSGRKADSEAMAEYLPKIPKETIMVFIETDVDRRGRLYKKAAELGCAVDCQPPSTQDLTKWLIRTAGERGKAMTASAAALLMRTCGQSMAVLFQETDKLLHYCGENKSVTPADIQAICTPTLESRIFDLTKAMGAGRAADALKIYRNMLILKESPIMILSMIIRQLRIILLCKCAHEKNMPKPQIAKELNLRDFVVAEALAHGRRFTAEQLISALAGCQDTDLRIKTGLISQEMGVEMLLIKLAI